MSHKEHAVYLTETLSNLNRFKNMYHFIHAFMVKLPISSYKYVHTTGKNATNARLFIKHVFWHH